MDKNKLYSIIITVLLIGGSLLLVWYLPSTFLGNKKVLDKNCSITKEVRTVNGNSLAPRIKDGDQVKIARGYYECYEVRRNDLVIYSYAGNDNPLIKIVRAVPGDKFELKKNDNNWNIIINGEKLTTSKGEPYRISGEKKEMLSLYAKDYPELPGGTYLVLGNKSSGSMDSTKFGLIAKEDLIGKAIKISNQ